MDAEITLVKIWSDDDMVELSIGISDGASSFSNKVYVGHRHLHDTVSRLEKFKDQIYGGIYEVKFGEFGPEYPSGAFHARLQFQARGRLHVTVSAQSEYFDFGSKNVASESTLYLTTEPAQLDDFIRGLRAMSKGGSETVKMKASAP